MKQLISLDLFLVATAIVTLDGQAPEMYTGTRLTNPFCTSAQ